jgi:hypothetical protein
MAATEQLRDHIHFHAAISGIDISVLVCSVYADIETVIAADDCQIVPLKFHRVEEK